MHHLTLLLLLVACSPKAETAPPADSSPPEEDSAAPTGDSAGPTEPATVEGCDGARFLAGSEDPAATGPWPVGVRSATIGRLQAELWYPALPGSEEGAEPATYDLRDSLPASQQGLIADADNPLQVCDCARDLPLDTAHGPYPVILFVHGTASFRTQSASFATRWASRGALVIAADHPGLWLHDTLVAVACTEDELSGSLDLEGDVDELLTALADPSGELAFLAGHVDDDRIALAGHSAGGAAVAELTDRPGVRAVLPMASSTAVIEGEQLQSTLFLGAMDDGVVPFSSTEAAYQASPSPRRLVGIEQTGHLAFSDLCGIQNSEGEDILTIATEAGVCGVELAAFLFDCDPDFLDEATVRDIVGHTSWTVLAEALHCAEPADLSDLQSIFPQVERYAESLSE